MTIRPFLLAALSAILMMGQLAFASKAALLSKPKTANITNISIEGSEKQVRLEQWDRIKVGLKGGNVLSRIGPETMSFLIALGAIEYVKLIFNPSNNPMGVYQQVESQTHPLTHLSFGAFMYANGVVAPILESLMTPQNELRKFIPYLGMSAGLIASDLVNEVQAVWGGKLDRCLGSLSEQVANFETVTDSCDKAYLSWSEYGMDYIQSRFPSITSLLVTTALAGQLEELTTKKMIYKLGLSYLLIPPMAEAKLAFKLGHWAIHTISNVSTFTGVSAVIEHPITDAIENLSQSTTFRYFEKDFFKSLVDAKKSNWSDTSTEQLSQDLLKSRFLFKGWRKLNIQKIEDIYNSWLAKVAEFASSYNLSKFVYEQFFSRSNKNNQRVADVTIMRQPAPLYGIMQSTRFGPPESLLLNPKTVMNKQLTTILEKSQEWLNRNAWPSNATPKEIQDTREYAKRLLLLARNASANSSENPDAFFKITNDIGKLFLEINKIAGYVDLHPGLWPSAKTQSPSGVWQTFRNFYGNPSPILQKGGVFFAALEQNDLVKSNSLAIDKITRHAGVYALRPSQSVFMDLFLGPFQSETHEIVKPMTINLPFTSLGAGLSEFHMPRMHQRSIDLNIKYEQDLRKHPREMYATLLNTPLEYEGMSFENFYDFTLYARDHFPELMDLDEKSTSRAWNKNILPLYKKAWETLEKPYSEFIETFAGVLTEPKEHFSNSGPLHTGVLAEIDLERKFYSFVIGELIRTFNQNNPDVYDKPVALKLTEKEIGPEKVFVPFDKGMVDADLNQVSLLRVLDANDVVPSVAQILKTRATWGKHLSSDPFSDRPLKLQEEIEQDFSQFYNAYISRTLTNNQIVDLRDRVIKRYDWLMEHPHTGIKHKLSDKQFVIYRMALTYLKGLIFELSSYLMINNEFNHYKSDENPGHSGIKDPTCVTVSGRTKFGASVNKSSTEKACIKE